VRKEHPKVLESSNHNLHLNTAIDTEAPVSGGTPTPETPIENASGLQRIRNFAETGKGKLTIAGGSILLLAGIGVGTKAGIDALSTSKVPQHSAPLNPGHTNEATPQASATPTPEATTSPEVAVPDISKYESMSVAEFSALSNDEQMIFAAAKLAPGIQQFASDYHSRTNNPTDILPVGSIDNTAQEIDSEVTYNLRYAFTLDGDDREKFIIAVLHNDNQSGIYPIIEDLSQKEVTTFTGKEMGYLKTINVGTATGMSDIGEDTNHDKFRTITDTIGTYKAYYFEIPMGDNTTYKTWIRE
jgi:hypothetical protein